MPDYAAIRDRARSLALDIFGAFHPTAADGLSERIGTLVLLGPHEPGFWPTFTASPEYGDGMADPLDRWSLRVIGSLACVLDAKALFPFGGPPFQPFIAWALKSGRAWQSPVGLLVHDTAGLMVSYRGALALTERLDLPAVPACPCDRCDGVPCLPACPCGALSRSGYDTEACHAWLSSGDGADCLSAGCLVRRACPVSKSYGRMPEQSAFHMDAFHK